MWRILQYEKADDFVLATGQQYSVKQFVEYAFAEIGRKIEYVCVQAIIRGNKLCVNKV